MTKLMKQLGVIVFLAVIVVGVSGCGNKYASPPAPVTSGDFPSHQIDINKYNLAIERLWDPNVTVPQKMVEDLMEGSGNISYPAAYTQAYNHILSTRLTQDVYSLYDSWEDIPFKEEDQQFNDCINFAEKARSERRDEICRSEKIVNPSRVEQLSRLEKQEKEGTLTDGGRNNLDEFQADSLAIYDYCALPAEVSHYLYVRQYVEWDQCEADFRATLKERGYLQ